MTADSNRFDDVMSPPEVVVTEEERVMCDGGGGALGHPKVWYELIEDDFVECMYCDKRFVKKGSPADPGA